jgi:hypothetical protein
VRERRTGRTAEHERDRGWNPLPLIPQVRDDQVRERDGPDTGPGLGRAE